VRPSPAPAAAARDPVAPHGGVVGVAGGLSLEGTVHVASPEGDMALPLRVASDRLVSRGAPFAANRVDCASGSWCAARRRDSISR
jgi:hypothetical protein